MLTDDAHMTIELPAADPIETPAPVSCPTCHALTLDVEAHADYHTAVANADPIILPTPVVD